METARAVRRRRRFSIVAALLTTVTVLLTVFLLGAGLSLLSSGGRNVAASFIHPQPGARSWNERDRLTVLLVGTDEDAQHNSAARSLLVASYAPGGNHLTVLALPTNLWVTIPGYGPAQLGTAYRDGGPRLQLYTVESVLHLPIAYYAAVGPATFAQIVNGMGGVSLTHSSVAAPVRGQRRTTTVTRHLDGPAAITYLRIAGNGPRGELLRLQMTRNLLLALRVQGLSPDNLFRVPTLINTLGGSIATNFPFNQIPDLAQTLSSLPSKQVNFTSLSYSNGALTGYSAAGESVFLPNWQRIAAESHRLFPLTPWPRGIQMRVLNGSNVPGQAIALSTWLQQAGVPVAGYATAKPVSATRVQLPAGAGSRLRQAARMAADLLQAPIVIVPARGARTLNVVIGSDFQDPTQK
ncbi:MAG: LCP family protein [Chloroflexota bacterium]